MKPFGLWICSLLIGFPLAWTLPGWSRTSVTTSSQYRTALAHPMQAGALLIAGDQQVFLAAGNALPQELWRISSTQAAIQRLWHFAALPDHLFVLTPKALYTGNLKTRTWQHIFYLGASDPEILHAFTVMPGQSSPWLLGTSKRFLISQDEGKTWDPGHGLTHASGFSLIQVAGTSLFVAAGDILYRSDDFFSFQPVFSLSKSASLTSAQELPEEAPDLEPEEAGISPGMSLTALLSGDDACSQLWLGTATGVIASPDCGKSWETLPQNGLRSIRIGFLAYAPGSRRLFAGTASGIYAFDPQKKIWQELYQGLSDTQPRALFVLPGETETLVTVTQDGILRFPISPLEVPDTQPQLAMEHLELFHRLLRAEPDARETQRAVIRYANVSNQKIKHWHWQSRLRAILPSFSFGRDFDQSNNLDIDRGSTSERDFYISGPEDWSRGWDWDVTWGLDDLIWSSNQTAIDSREKLMVDLRHDFLGEVTRIFYERRRLQMEIALLPSATAAEHFGKLLRLEELTSLLDAMTDGFFSQRVRAAYAANPEFATLWEYEEI